jgi:hypothetical protein
MAKILADCRDLAVHRLMLAFSAMLDRVGDLLMERAGRTDVRDEQALYLDARALLKSERSTLMPSSSSGCASASTTASPAASRRRPITRTSTRPSSRSSTSRRWTSRSSPATSRASSRTPATRSSRCSNRGFGHLLGRPDLETVDNPMSPETIVDAFTEALRQIKTESRIKFQILKELNQASLGDIASIYGDINRHLANLRVVPSAASRTSVMNRAAAQERRATMPRSARRRSPSRSPRST